MNKHLIKSVLLFVLAFIAFACESEIERIQIQTPIERPAEYYENLRAFKRSKHQISCGWYKNWLAKGPCRANYLDGLPDSLDLVFLGWGGWKNLTAGHFEDLRKVQQQKGTRVLISFVIADFNQEMLPNGYEGDKNEFWGWDNSDKAKQEAAIRKFANAICDSVDKYGYDGFDLDYEPHYGGHGVLASYPERMVILVEELGKRLGPESGTGKLLVLDGEIMDPSVADRSTKYFDYFVEQSYNAMSPSSLDGRFSGAKRGLVPPERYVPAVNYENWETGGGNFYHPEYGTIPAILGFAYWNTVDGPKGGVGALNMENDFKQSDREYSLIRQAIQIMNPAKH